MNRKAFMSDKNSNGVSYFKSLLIPGLTVVTGEPLEGQVAPQSVRFTPYDIKPKVGDTVTIGYLKTDDAVAIEKLRADSNVEEIEKDEYTEYTKVDGDKIKKARL